MTVRIYHLTLRDNDDHFHENAKDILCWVFFDVIVVTVRIRRMGEGNIFSLSVSSHLDGGRGLPHPAEGGGYPSQDPGWGYPISGQGVPHPR